MAVELSATATAYFSGIEVLFFVGMMLNGRRKSEIVSMLLLAGAHTYMLIRTEILRDLHTVGEMMFVSVNDFG